MILSKKRYIFCNCILDNDDNLIFDLNVCYVSYFIISLTVFESVRYIYIYILFYNFDLKQHCKEQDNNNRLWKHKRTSFHICLPIGKKLQMSVTIKNQIKSTLIK